MLPALGVQGLPRVATAVEVLFLGAGSGGDPPTWPPGVRHVEDGYPEALPMEGAGRVKEVLAPDLRIRAASGVLSI